MTITRQQAVKVLKDHGFQPWQQTEALNGELVNGGTSFNEIFGIRANYNILKLKEWLGY